MTVQILINDLKKWAEEKICNIQFKRPSDKNTDQTYDYKLVKPAVFAMFVPTEDRLPAGVEDIFPSVCIQWTDDDERPQEHKGSAKIRLQLGLWNPGLHAEDILADYTAKEGELAKPTPGFTRDAEGWGDLINWIDLIKRELRNNDFICGKYRIKLEDGVQSGPASEQGTILDFYPYYFGYVEFAIEYSNPQAKSFNNLL